MYGLGGLGSCNEDQLLGFIKAFALRGVNNEVHMAAFQSMLQQQGKFYKAYVAKLKAKAELCQYMIVAPVCKNNYCNCSWHIRQLLLQGWWRPSLLQGRSTRSTR